MTRNTLIPLRSPRSVYVIYKGISSYSFSTAAKNGCYLICAGAIGNLICNFIYIMWMSWEPSPVQDMPALPAAEEDAEKK